MNRNRLFPFAALAAMAMMDLKSDPLFDERIPRSIVPDDPPRPNSLTNRSERLASKGLSTFVINGEEIIAHSEREAQKRYKARHKK